MEFADQFSVEERVRMALCALDNSKEIHVTTRVKQTAEDFDIGYKRLRN
jgi:hypothetical protein